MLRLYIIVELFTEGVESLVQYSLVLAWWRIYDTESQVEWSM